MKKFLSIVCVFAICGLVACGPSEEEKAAAQEEAETAVNDMMDNLEATMDEAVEGAEEAVEETEGLLAEHACNDECSEEEGCNLVCGEKGHECSDSCGDHAEGEEVEEVSGEEDHSGHDH